MDLTTFIERNFVQCLVNFLFIIFLTYDVRITGSPFLKRPVANQFLTSGNTPRAKRMRSSQIAGSSSSLVELEGWGELILGKRSGGGEVLKDGRMTRLVEAISRLERDTEQLQNFFPDMDTSPEAAKRGRHLPEGRYSESDAAAGAFLDSDFPQARQGENAHYDENLTPLEMMRNIKEKLQKLEGDQDRAGSSKVTDQYHRSQEPEADKNFW